ncbi:MAG TPA: hypothetical protein VNW73_12240 [Ktedonobacteraceae bacterium]|nr:hypothetical protein [Ktedonobacteraceae bacterium]
MESSNDLLSTCKNRSSKSVAASSVQPLSTVTTRLGEGLAGETVVATVKPVSQEEL